MPLNFLFIACMAIGLAAPAFSGESYVLAPRSLEEIANDNFRIALADRAPDYDNLVRREQVFHFIQAYKSLNNGQDPALTDRDAWQVGLPGGLRRYPVPYYYPAGYSAERQAYFPGYGYHRLRPLQAAPPGLAGYVTPYAAAPRYRDTVPPNIRHRTVPLRSDPVHVEPIRVEPIHVEPRHVEPVDARY